MPNASLGIRKCHSFEMASFSQLNLFWFDTVINFTSLFLKFFAKLAKQIAKKSWQSTATSPSTGTTIQNPLVNDFS